MNKWTLPVALLGAVLLAASPVRAGHQKEHALGDMYTTVLNMLEMRGALGTFDSGQHASVLNMHMDHGQVFVTLEEENKPRTVVYDPIAHKIITP